MPRKRIYVNTSVFGGTEDEEFSEASREFFRRAREGITPVLVSPVTVDELEESPPKVREVMPGLPPEAIEQVSIDSEVQELAQAYVAAGVLGEGWMDDALHVAAATVRGADLIVSWNFRHFVNYDRIRKFNAVNLMKGYHAIDIRRPSRS